MKEGSIDRKKYQNEWVLICNGKVVKHSADVSDILECPGHEGHRDCYMEKVVEGQVCFF